MLMCNLHANLIGILYTILLSFTILLTPDVILLCIFISRSMLHDDGVMRVETCCNI
jgi:hypothetical protein